MNRRRDRAPSGGPIRPTRGPERPQGRLSGWLAGIRILERIGAPPGPPVAGTGLRVPEVRPGARKILLWPRKRAGLPPRKGDRPTRFYHRLRGLRAFSPVPTRRSPGGAAPLRRCAGVAAPETGARLRPNHRRPAAPPPIRSCRAGSAGSGAKEEGAPRFPFPRDRLAVVFRRRRPEYRGNHRTNTDRCGGTEEAVRKDPPFRSGESEAGGFFLRRLCASPGSRPEPPGASGPVGQLPASTALISSSSAER